MNCVKMYRGKPPTPPPPPKSMEMVKGFVQLAQEQQGLAGSGLMGAPVEFFLNEHIYSAVREVTTVK